jgi:Na+/proline symporter
MASKMISMSTLDWGIFYGYLAFALCLGFAIRKKITNRVDYFLAGRNLPWWLAGSSIAATTFAADTPLAITGIVAAKGLSGNWIWFPWILIHAGVVLYFSKKWNQTGVLTDSEFVELRYEGKTARVLRYTRAGLSGLVFNCIVMGWVIRAMVKIISPFFHWDQWAPGLYNFLLSIWPSSAALGSPSEGMTIFILLIIVLVYSTMGGIRGVIITDMFQLVMALTGSIWLACKVWTTVGGVDALQRQMAQLYGHAHTYLDLFPSLERGWASTLDIGLGVFMVYLIVQSYTNIPADGGGYFMQRLNTTKNAGEAKKAMTLFVAIHFLLRTWPWFIVAAGALILIPLGNETSILGDVASVVASDRELAYPVLMGTLLPPVVIGLMITSLMAAFMSTIDTHINWGASYLVNDVYLSIRPDSTAKQQLLVAKMAVVLFMILGVFVSFQIQNVEQGWKWYAAIGASLGIPTFLRWWWWRVTAISEFMAIAFGLTSAVILFFTDLEYEKQIIVTSGISILGMFVGMKWKPAQVTNKLLLFIKKVEPHGFWPGKTMVQGWLEVVAFLIKWVMLVAGVLVILHGQQVLFFQGRWIQGLAWMAIGVWLWMYTHQLDIQNQPNQKTTSWKKYVWPNVLRNIQGRVG